MEDTFPLESLFIFVMIIFPQLMKVTVSSCFNTLASAPSTKTLGPYHTVLLPTSWFLGCLATSADWTHASTMFTCTNSDSSRAVYRGTTGSITFLLYAQILSHSIMLTEREDPCVMINCFNPSTVIPLLRTPRTVGNLGSSHPSTNPSPTNHVSFLLDITVFCKFNLLYS